MLQTLFPDMGLPHPIKTVVELVREDVDVLPAKQII
jgi:hypothetical protein